MATFSRKAKPGKLLNSANRVPQLKIWLGRWATGLALIALAGWMQWRLLDGTLSYYLHPRFFLPVAITSLVITLLGGWILWSGENSKFNFSEGLSGVALFSLIALLGWLITPKPLDTALFSTDSALGLGSGSSNRVLADVLLKKDWNEASLDTSHWNLLDWSAGLNEVQRAEKLVGHPVDLIGFVVRPETEKNSYFWLGRYVVVCCTADSTALRLPVVSDKSAQLEEGQWVRVQGILGRGSNGVMAFVANAVEVVPRPAQPYLYP